MLVPFYVSSLSWTSKWELASASPSRALLTTGQGYFHKSIFSQQLSISDPKIMSRSSYSYMLPERKSLHCCKYIFNEASNESRNCVNSMEQAYHIQASEQARE